MGILEEYAAFKSKLVSDISDVLEHEVADAVKRELHTYIHDVVYPAYTPKQYVRRMDQGGLSDQDNFEVRVEDTTLYVQDVATANPPSGDLMAAPFVEEGSGFQWQGIPPRPFHKPVEEIMKSGELDTALAEGLSVRGYEMGIEGIL